MKLCNFIDLRHCVIFVSRGTNHVSSEKSPVPVSFGGFPVPAFAGNGIGGGWGCLLYERKLPAGGYVGRGGGGRDRRARGKTSTCARNLPNKYTLENGAKMALGYPTAILAPFSSVYLFGKFLAQEDVFPRARRSRPPPPRPTYPPAGSFRSYRRHPHPPPMPLPAKAGTGKPPKETGTGLFSDETWFVPLDTKNDTMSQIDKIA